MGTVALLTCLVVSLVLVLILQDTYRKQVSSEFQSQHVAAGNSLNRILNADGEELSRLAVQLLRSERADIPSELEKGREFSSFDELWYVDAELGVLKNGEPQEDLPVELFLTLLMKLEYNESGVYIGITPSALRWPLGQNAMTAVPVGDGAFVFIPLDLEALFATDVFSYQVSLGECLVVTKVGEIIAWSEDSFIVDMGAESLQQAVLDYSDGGRTSKQAWHNYTYDVTRGASGYVTILTRDGYRMQISYCPLRSAQKLYFISCYKDNLLEKRLQPLLFGSVLACSIIIVFMIVALGYVWATAKNTNLTVERLAYEDTVTGGKNLNYFREFAFNVMLQSRETPFVIYRFDIANFRYINESYGHQRADKVLVSCIENFSKRFSEKELCVRMDADQFLALMINDSLLDKRFDEYNNDVNADARGNNIKYPVRFKCGIYPVKKQDHDIDVMIDHANVARKTVGSDSRNLRAVYSEHIVDDMRKVDHIESRQQKALAENEFKVWLQPKWDIYANRITGAEALVRWERADGTVVQPGQFIPVFENNGFIEQLDFYTLEAVCRRMHELIEEGVAPLPVSVNQSRLLLHSPDYVENVEKLIKQYSVPAGAIELEITESVFDNERDEMIGIIRRLKLLGVRLSMDDFGAGYSSLKMLTEVPFDVIKIDGQFFAESARNDKERLILTKIVEMVDSLGMEVVCEGVESEEQVNFLQRIGCRKVQGYYFSRPVSEPDFIRRYYKNGSEN
ncbi:MAG: EAL domain-containing protein [Lachnospiraceae bacterium]|nr:EAL domain-containing protein [Lachnospiraceae bacterium]